MQIHLYEYSLRSTPYNVSEWGAMAHRSYPLHSGRRYIAPCAPSNRCSVDQRCHCTPQHMFSAVWEPQALFSCLPLVASDIELVLTGTKVPSPIPHPPSPQLVTLSTRNEHGRTRSVCFQFRVLIFIACGYPHRAVSLLRQGGSIRDWSTAIVEPD